MQIDLMVDPVNEQDPTTWNYDVLVREFLESKRDANRTTQTSEDKIVKAIVQGVTQKRNSEFFDAQHKAGIFLKALNDDPQYRHGSSNKGNLNTYMDLSKRILEKDLGIKITPETQTLFDKYAKWTEAWSSETYFSHLQCGRGGEANRRETSLDDEL